MRFSGNQLLWKSFAIFFCNTLMYSLVSALVLSPWIATELWLFSGAHDDRTQVQAEVLGMLYCFTSPLVTCGLLCEGVVGQLRGQPVSTWASVTRGLRRFGLLFGTAVACALRTLTWSLFLIVPGFVQVAKLFVAVPVAVMEGHGSSVAMRRSDRLTDGSRWILFGSWFLVRFAFSILLVAALLHFELVWEGSSGFWFMLIFEVMIQGLGATLMAVAYFMFRREKDGGDATDIASVFDRS